MIDQSTQSPEPTPESEPQPAAEDSALKGVALILAAFVIGFTLVSLAMVYAPAPPEDPGGDFDSVSDAVEQKVENSEPEPEPVSEEVSKLAITHITQTDDSLYVSGNSSASSSIRLTFGQYDVFITKADELGSWEADISMQAFSTSSDIVKAEERVSTERSWYRGNTATATVSISVPERTAQTLAVDWFAGAPIRYDQLQNPVDILSALVAAEYGTNNLYYVGTSRSPEFAGYGVYMYQGFCDGMCYGYGMTKYFLLRPDGEQLIAVEDGDIWWMRNQMEEGRARLNFSNRFPIRADLKVPSVGASKTVMTVGAQTPMRLLAQDYVHDFSSTTKYRQIDTLTDGRPLYLDMKDGRFYVPLKDGRAARYMYDLTFMDDDQVPQITWFDGTQNTADYSYVDRIGGCGYTRNDLAVRPNISPADLQSTAYTWAGVTQNDVRMYTITDPQDQRLVELHEKFGWRGYGESRESVTYSQFIDSRPLVYWVTPHDMVVEMRRGDYRPQAECGKPVVYLYPEAEIDAHVFVDLKGPMTVSEPPHGAHGWSVTARPNGYVVDHTDGTVWPNLYWEGFGVEYDVPEAGFVVPGDEIDTWLPATLDEIGFTEREKTEFLEFWLPHLPRTPYVFFTFVDQSYFDRDAALIIDPQPDVVTRVFMEYQPLAEYKEVPKQQLPKIERRGFTVVEWGGILYR